MTSDIFVSSSMHALTHLLRKICAKAAAIYFKLFVPGSSQKQMKSRERGSVCVSC